MVTPLLPNQVPNYIDIDSYAGSQEGEVSWKTALNVNMNPASVELINKAKEVTKRVRGTLEATGKSGDKKSTKVSKNSLS